MKNIDIQSNDTKKYEYIIHTKNYKKNILLTKYNQIVEYIDSNLTMTSNMSFLEIGFNDGLLLKSMQKKYPKAKFIGVEVRKSCVDNMVKQGFDCRLITNEIFPINEKFDVIYGASVLHHISKPFDFIKHLFNALKYNEITGGGGILIFVNEAHRYDLVSNLYAIITGNWKYEKYALKLTKNKLDQLLFSISNNYYFNNIPPICITGFKMLNNIYCKLKLNYLPFFNSISFVVKKEHYCKCKSL